MYNTNQLKFESLLYDMKRSNEVIDSILFCIRFHERLFDNTYEDTKKFFHLLFEFKIKIF